MKFLIPVPYARHHARSCHHDQNAEPLHRTAAIPSPPIRRRWPGPRTSVANASSSRHRTGRARISSGPRRADHRAIAASNGGGVIDPDAADLRVDVNMGVSWSRWRGHAARGKTVETYSSARGGDLLGVRTVEVLLNDDVRWRNVPEPVWDTPTAATGAQEVAVVRESDVQGLDLQWMKVRTISEIARRIARSCSWKTS